MVLLQRLAAVWILRILLLPTLLLRRINMMLILPGLLYGVRVADWRERYHCTPCSRSAAAAAAAPAAAAGHVRIVAVIARMISATAASRRSIP